MPKSKQIDFLFEDPEVPTQRYALVTIVGPHMNQKCDVWGMKVRGVTDTIEKARQMTSKLMKIDNNYDIYTVEVGKFFPLAVEPHAVGQVEYQNEQLNALMKTYLENRELANDHWHQRKNELIKEAIKEGKEQERLSQKPEHPVAVLQRIKTFEEKLANLKEMVDDVTADLQAAKDKFTAYTDEEKELASKELTGAISSNMTPGQEASIEEIRKELLEELTLSSNAMPNESSDISHVLTELQEHEKELNELQMLLESLSEESSPILYKKTKDNIVKMEEHIEDLKQRLHDKNAVNNFINSNYQGSELNALMSS